MLDGLLLTNSGAFTAETMGMKRPATFQNLADKFKGDWYDPDTESKVASKNPHIII